MSTAASQPRSDPARIVLMGVSGSGKSAVGALLAERLGACYFDADPLHPGENIAKMRRGEPLTDADRAPWLDAVGRTLADAPPIAIVGCSALKRAYRDRIRQRVGAPVVFVHLSGSRDLIAIRMRGRSGHFMPLSLLDSQFAALEPPAADEHAVTVDIDRPLAEIVALIAQTFGKEQAA